MGFVAIFIGLIYISRISKLNISQIEISGNNVIDTEAIKELVNSNLTGKYFWVFPKTNFVIFPKNKIINELATKFKRLKNISIETDRKNPQILDVTVSEREAKYTWCGAEKSLVEDSSEKCYFLDDGGYVFDVAPYFSNEVYFKFYGVAKEGSDDPSGAYFSQNIFSKLVLFKEAVGNIGLKPSAFVLENSGGIYMTIFPKNSLNENPKIILTTDLDFEKAARNLQKALDTDPLKTDFEKKYASLQYIDLRFGNKVYYKFQ